MTIPIRTKLKTLVCLMLMMPLVLLWRIHADNQNLNQSERHLWQQPLSLTERFPERLSESSWQFDFEAIEQALFEVKQNESGELILNSSTAKILENAVTNLPTVMQDSELQRVSFLIVKGFPGHAGQQLAQLITGLYRLQQVPVTSSELTQDLEAKEQSFEQTVLRQKLYLGNDFAEQLYGKKNTVTRYLFARHRINQNTNLNQEQKQQQLSILEDGFKASEH